MTEKSDKPSNGEVALFTAVSGLAAVLEPNLELAPLGADEQPVDHATRLLNSLRTSAQARIAEREQIDVFLTRGLADRGINATEFESPAAAALLSLDAGQREAAGLKRQLAAQKGQATRVRNERDALAEVAGREPRPVPAEGLEALKPDDLWLQLQMGDEIEVVASDGRREIVGIPPLETTPGAWRFNGRRISLLPDMKFEVFGPGPGKEPFRIVGWGLFVDGKPAAYAPRATGQLDVGPGLTFDLTGDVIF